MTMEIQQKIDKLNNEERLETLNLNKIFNYFKLNSLTTIVDLGTGTGLFAKEILKINPEAHCIGVEVNEKIYQWTKNNIEKALDNFTIKLSNGKDINLEDHSQALVVLINVFHELIDRDYTLQEVKRILKDNGKILIIDRKPGAEIKHKNKLFEMNEMKKKLINHRFKSINEYRDHGDYNILLAEK